MGFYQLRRRDEVHCCPTNIFENDPAGAHSSLFENGTNSYPRPIFPCYHCCNDVQLPRQVMQAGARLFPSHPTSFFSFRALLGFLSVSIWLLSPVFFFIKRH